ncbi:2,3-diketo-5-methylthiopentyl-1-phosphate enolase [Paenibacillus sp. FSL H7-689]|nr:2,3-diketo-5-methylthiopentyl-1-phosphate enolase [Paenibacillus sp. FSL H7-689]
MAVKAALHGHPLGTAAGGRAFRQAIEAVMTRESLHERAERHPELKQAIELWGLKQ